MSGIISVVTSLCFLVKTLVGRYATFKWTPLKSRRLLSKKYNCQYLSIGQYLPVAQRIVDQQISGSYLGQILIFFSDTLLVYLAVYLVRLRVKEFYILENNSGLLLYFYFNNWWTQILEQFSVKVNCTASLAYLTLKINANVVNVRERSY